MNKEVIPVILLTYQDSELIKPLLETIQEDHIDLRIIVLDNGSTDATWECLSKINDSRVTLIQTKCNLGYTGGINHAIKYAINNIENFKHFFILNPDAQATPNLIYNLSRILYYNEQYACISPKIFSLSGEITYSGGQIDFKNGIVNHIVFTEDNYPSESYEVDAYHGCAVLCDVQKFIKAGMLNEDLFIYYDEADLSMKLKHENYKILYAPALEVYHDNSYTMRKVSYLKTYYMARNKFILFNKSMALSTKLYYIANEFAHHIKNRRIKNATFLLKGVYHFLKGKKGSYHQISANK